MKKDIHPRTTMVEVTCSCGQANSVMSTYDKPTLKLDVCNHCHPFFTGKQRVLDSGGRVEKFKKRFGALQR